MVREGFLSMWAVSLSFNLKTKYMVLNPCVATEAVFKIPLRAGKSVNQIIAFEAASSQWTDLRVSTLGEAFPGRAPWSACWSPACPLSMPHTPFPIAQLCFCLFSYQRARELLCRVSWVPLGKGSTCCEEEKH